MTAAAVHVRRRWTATLLVTIALLGLCVPLASWPGTAGAAGAPPPDSAVPFGAAPVGANAVANPNAPVVGMAATPDGDGYWLVASDGGVFSYGDARFSGSTGALHLNAPITGMAAAPGGGYWLVARDGGIFNYGGARFFGSAGNLPLRAPIVGVAATPDGGGYWLVASDGGVFSYGDARFFGSTGGVHLNAPMVGMAATASGAGYWLVAADGGIFSYGDAPFSGSTGALHLNAPIAGMAAAPGGGYWLVARDGGVFTYGSAAYFGSLGAGALTDPVVGMAATPSGGGYWLVLGSGALDGKVVGIDPGHNGLNGDDPGAIDQPVFNGVDDEPCDTTGTETAGGYTEAEFNFNVASDLQADLAAEGATVVMTRNSNEGVGPCVTTRAAIINAADANVAVDIHAAGPPVSDYGGAVDGFVARNDLAGLNLTTVPKVLMECGNMQNAGDAALLESPSFQQSAANAMAEAITEFLTGRPA